jgi:hypothetical protein
MTAINRGYRDGRANYENLPENKLRAYQLDCCIAELLVKMAATASLTLSPKVELDVLG